MANSAFYHSLLVFVLLTEYFETWEKSKVALITLEVSETETGKQIIFTNWSIINGYSEKWDRTIQKFLKILKISQSSSYFIVFICKYTV